MRCDATYFIAQMIPNLFRKEPVNVGVFVVKAGRIAGRFFGEKSPGGEIDGRKIKKFDCPGVYVQWVDYWKRTTATHKDPIVQMMKSNGENYNVVMGGQIADTGADIAEDIAAFLFPLLVTNGGLREALGIAEEVTTEVAVQKLKSELDDAFKDEGLLSSDSQYNYGILYPIKKQVPISGTRHNVVHKPSYVQTNGKVWVMEAIDFTARNKTSARETAGWAAFMFEDIIEKKKNSNVEVAPIAIVRINEDDAKSDEVKYGLDMLRATTEKIVYWNDLDNRVAFIKERLDVATSPS